MSNSIWHKRDETPKDFCDVVLADFATGSCCVFLSPFHNVSFDYDRWAYLTDIIAQADKAERLLDAVNIALYALDDIKHQDDTQYDKQIATKAFDEIKQLTKENQ